MLCFTAKIFEVLAGVAVDIRRLWQDYSDRAVDDRLLGSAPVTLSLVELASMFSRAFVEFSRFSFNCLIAVVLLLSAMIWLVRVFYGRVVVVSSMLAQYRQNSNGVDEDPGRIARVIVVVYGFSCS